MTSAELWNKIVVPYNKNLNSMEEENYESV